MSRTRPHRQHRHVVLVCNRYNLAEFWSSPGKKTDRFDSRKRDLLHCRVKVSHLVASSGVHSGERRQRRYAIRPKDNATVKMPAMLLSAGAVVWAKALAQREFQRSRDLFDLIPSMTTTFEGGDGFPIQRGWPLGR